MGFHGKPKRNMKNHLMRLADKLPDRKRPILETMMDPLKNIAPHSRTLLRWL